MNRRSLFGRLAAVAAAVTLAPVAKAEAGPEYAVTTITTPDIGVPVDAALYVQGKTVLDGDLIVNGRSLTDLLAEARAEGYERRAYIEAMKAESRAMRGLRVGEFHAERITIANTGGHNITYLPTGQVVKPGETATL